MTTVKQKQTKSPARSGRKPYLPTAKQIAFAYAKAKVGWTQKGVAFGLGITEPTWAKMKERDPRLAEAYERGREEWHNSLIRDVTRMSKGGNVAAPIFLLKARFGYRENDAPQQMQPQIVISLPGPASAADYAKVIEATREALPALPELSKETRRG